MRLTPAQGGNSSWSLLCPFPCLTSVHTVSIYENMPTLRSLSTFLHSSMILLQLPLNFMLVIIFSIPSSHHYISFSSSSSPPRVDSSPGMTLPRPFNRREEGRPPTGCRLQKYHRFKIPSMRDESRQRKALLRGWIVVLVKFCYKKGSSEANYTSCKQLPLLQS